MNQEATAALDVPARPVLRNPKGPAVWCLERSDSDTLVLAPARPAGWPARANMSLAGWLALWFFLGGFLLLGGLLALAMLGVALTVPAYWAIHALGRGAWSEAVAGAAIELLLLTAMVLAVLAISSSGRWVTFDRRHGVLTISRRPFGWRRPPRVVRSQSLAEIVAVQLGYAGRRYRVSACRSRSHDAVNGAKVRLVRVQPRTSRSCDAAAEPGQWSRLGVDENCWCGDRPVLGRSAV